LPYNIVTAAHHTAGFTAWATRAILQYSTIYNHKGLATGLTDWAFAEENKLKAT
jgi:hypothetical protein